MVRLMAKQVRLTLAKAIAKANLRRAEAGEKAITMNARDLSGKLSARGAELSTEMSVLRVEVQGPRGRGVVVIDSCLWSGLGRPSPDRGCCRSRPWRGPIGQPRGPELLRVKQLQVSAIGDG